MKGIKNSREEKEIIRPNISCYLHDDLTPQFSPWLENLADNRGPYRDAFVTRSFSSFKIITSCPLFFIQQPLNDTKTVPASTGDQCINSFHFSYCACSLVARLLQQFSMW